ncbi:MAG: 2-amino-4-hydroxy-6-hydroxymethyldihydropteridine diphosphokinase [Methylococcaceae bacterium]|nr:2-amino-4-hydroxy-6-hydroxymethyldihydropteridine diphosphokinase [Methylococcaceae bacterium]MDZ4157028.1 2-amino-4-hydroxy-6-hydroxymethyldihydropteridine diphosphokinase [Methylococcales bacterium]MDP2394219.1 2-amino-4-hydroxy-6-hydroxymethyldihydropteridine diphosphokinase [Methylococcaceae bacterium]MDP3020047.1 2-amino-4-hydroxy-6-hydroxymethyldihydropteridine diphosphokinase [Methylococcaceae bacterium]MDP3388789.1 2-amino-4-hydroxy-6-hydroxymethyldihydropteridine diphosphokinase [Me
MTRGYISIGSNIDKETNIPASLKALEEYFGNLTVSSIYESEAVGFTGDSFHNLIVGFDSDLDVKSVAKQLRQIELDHGRSRNSEKFSPRTLDLDLILYGDIIINDGRLQIPRDEIERYAFVLEPLAEIAPTLKHPVSQVTYENLWKNFDKTMLKQWRLATKEASTK